MNRPRFDPLALIAGLFFTVIGIVALAVGTDAIADAMWLWPVLFCVLGAGFLAAAALRAGRGDDDPAGDLDLD